MAVGGANVVAGAGVNRDGRNTRPRLVVLLAILALLRFPIFAHAQAPKTAAGPKASATRAELQIKQDIIRQSIASYSGSCPCPYNADRAGRSCGRRSAYSRPGSSWAESLSTHGSQFVVVAGVQPCESSTALISLARCSSGASSVRDSSESSKLFSSWP